MPKERMVSARRAWLERSSPATSEPDTPSPSVSRETGGYWYTAGSSSRLRSMS